MDSVTQILLGAAVGEAVLGNRVGNKAMLYGAIAGTIPDLDVISGAFVDTVTALEWHRGFTHSIVFSVLGGLFFGWLTSLWETRASWKQWSWLWFACFITHPLLDAHTTWGTQLFWPLDLRLAYKNIFVIDPLYTVPFFVLVVLAAFQKRGSPRRQRYNKLGLVISTAYLGLTLVFKYIAIQKFEAALQRQNISYTHIETRPSPFNTVLWYANVMTDDAILMGAWAFFDSQPITFHPHLKNHGALGALANEDKVERLQKISNGWFTISEKEGNIYYNDLRFGLLGVDPATTKYAFSYLLKPTSNGLAVREEPKKREDAERLREELWRRVKGN
jgi:inner membrane protein